MGGATGIIVYMLAPAEFRDPLLDDAARLRRGFAASAGIHLLAFLLASGALHIAVRHARPIAGAQGARDGVTLVAFTPRPMARSSSASPAAPSAAALPSAVQRSREAAAAALKASGAPQPAPAPAPTAPVSPAAPLPQARGVYSAAPPPAPINSRPDPFAPLPGRAAAPARQAPVAALPPAVPESTLAARAAAQAAAAASDYPVAPPDPYQAPSAQPTWGQMRSAARPGRSMGFGGGYAGESSLGGRQTSPSEGASAPAPATSQAPALGNPAGSGGENRDAQAVQAIVPRFPPGLKESGTQLVVKVQVAVAADASTDVSLLQTSGSPEVDRSVLDALRRWRWRPAVKDGQPFASVVTFNYTFTVD